MGCSEPRSGRGGSGSNSAGGVFGEDGGERIGCEIVGPADGGAESRVGGRVRDSLWVELGVGIGVRWCADAWLADLCGAEDESAFPGS
ncbi:hypothetical protein LINPERHAP1_LOCUS38433 [Linum perenne]